MKTKVTMLLLGLGLVFTLACSKYPPDTERLLEDLVVITQYDVDANFNQYKTYAIPNTIVKITETGTDSTFTNANVQTLLAQISKNMNSRGFVEFTAPSKPDLQISVVAYENVQVQAYYPYYSWGYDYYGWGYYYPYYPTYYYTYTTGLVGMQLVDLKNPGPNHTLYLRWSAGIRGLLTGYHTVLEMTNAVDQAFIQTPQLQTSAK